MGELKTASKRASAAKHHVVNHASHTQHRPDRIMPHAREDEGATDPQNRQVWSTSRSKFVCRERPELGDAADWTTDKTPETAFLHVLDPGLLR